MEYKQPVDLKQTPSSNWDYHKARTFAQIELQQVQIQSPSSSPRFINKRTENKEKRTG